MKNHNSDAMELTIKMIQIDSGDPGAYEGKMGDFLVQYFDGLGVPVIKREVLPGRFNIMARLEGEKDVPALVFICHMDTVPAGEGWSVPVLGGEVKMGRIYGRGACDMKSGLACALSAFAHAADHVKNGGLLKRPLVFIGTVDEEDFMRGVETAISDGWVTGDCWALDAEPTDGHIQQAHKGRTWFEITVTGITAHAATPWKGADAIAAMSLIIVSLNRQVASCPAHPDLGSSTVTFGRIEGGSQPYAVSGSCTVTVDFRLVPPGDTAFAVKMVSQALEEAKREISGINADYRITGDRPCVNLDREAPLLKCLSSVCQEVNGEPAGISVFPGYTDTAVIAGTLSNPNCLSYGPGSLELAHKPDEYVPCEDILRCEEVLMRLVERLIFSETSPS